MKANERLDRQVKHKTVTITGKHETKITFLGSSCPASVNPGDCMDSFSLFPGEEEAVCAVQISYAVMRGKYGGWEYQHFLLEISRGDDGNPKVELEHVFVPKSDRMGQIVPEVGVTVRIGEEFFLAPLLVSSYDTEKKLTALRTKYRLVSVENANLLCRFIAGKATVEEVKAAAEELVVQTVDVPALKAKLAEAEERAENLDLERIRFQSLLLTTKEDFEMMRKELGKEQSNLRAELKKVCDVDLRTHSAFIELKESYDELLQRLAVVIDEKDEPGWYDRLNRQKLSRITRLVTAAHAEFAKLK